MTSGSHEATIGALVEELVGARSFHEAARVTLRTVLAVAESVLAETPSAKGGRVLRSVAHLRPADGYRGLAVLERGTDTLATPGPRDPRLSSTTAWRWVATARRGVSIDVNVGKVLLHGGGEASLSSHPGGPTEFRGSESHLGLMARDVTHVLVLPLRGPLGSVDGMLSVEAACRPAIGGPWLWERGASFLQLVADLAAPHLGRLPPEVGGSGPVDRWLPVVGPSMQPLVEMLAVFAQQDEPLLLKGPTGSGKSRLARWCHERSSRRGEPFEVLDLCAVPEALQMAELFGWRRGAFTGAARDNPGSVARAEGGTLFIDEIDSLSAQAQAGLLRVLEEHAYRRLGDDGGKRRADVRFIIGTHANLQTAVKEGRFREDLYYRINVLPVTLPALRDRIDEIPRWARFMANRRHSSASSDGAVTLTPKAEELLVRYDWPGNLRQLDNIVRRAYAIALLDQQGVAPLTMTLSEESVRRAMTYEETQSERTLIDALLAAALAFVQEAERRGAGALDLDTVDAFKGLVLAAATEKYEGDREKAFALFGRDRLAKSRNHHKVLRREMDRLSALCHALGEERVPFAGLLGADEDEKVDERTPTDID